MTEASKIEVGDITSAVGASQGTRFPIDFCPSVPPFLLLEWVGFLHCVEPVKMSINNAELLEITYILCDQAPNSKQ